MKLKIGDTVYVRGQEGYQQPSVYFLIKTKVKNVVKDPDHYMPKKIGYRLENGRWVDDGNFGRAWWVYREEGLNNIKELNKSYRERILRETEEDLNKLLKKKAYWESVYVDTAYVKEDI